MKKYYLYCTVVFLLITCTAFTQTAKELQETARAFMQQGDYGNAILVLNKATQMEPQNIEIGKDLAMSYYFQKDNAKALEIVKALLEREDTDDQCYQIAGNIYKQLDLIKDCEKLYKRGIRKFPGSGPLYNELGELLWSQQDYNAIKQWERGIEADPDYSRNYYNACKYYYLTADKAWTVLYGETFVNLEPLGNRTPEIKTILLESYKKFFFDTNTPKENNSKNGFADAFVQTLNRESVLSGGGINPESLTMIRTRFILDWFQANAVKYPFRLFELQRQLLQEGMFDAYNQWIFGTAQNLAAYQNWTITHPSEYDEFNRFQRGRNYKIPQGQHYR